MENFQKEKTWKGWGRKSLEFCWRSWTLVRVLALTNKLSEKMKKLLVGGRFSKESGWEHICTLHLNAFSQKRFEMTPSVVTSGAQAVEFNAHFLSRWQPWNNKKVCWYFLLGLKLKTEFGVEKVLWKKAFRDGWFSIISKWTKIAFQVFLSRFCVKFGHDHII